MNNDETTLDKKEKLEADEKVNKHSEGMNWETSQVRNIKILLKIFLLNEIYKLKIY
jgi:hypothetical protein